MQQYFVEQAITYDEAERKAKEKYGDRITILLHETVKISGGFFNFFPKYGVKITGIIPRYNRVVPNMMQPVNAYGNVVGGNTQDLMVKEASYTPRELNFAEEKEKLLAMGNAGKDNTAFKEVMEEIKGIKEKLENQGLSTSREEHPNLNRIEDILILNDFPPTYRKNIIDRIKKEFSIDALSNFFPIQDKVIEWIGESIKIFEGDTFKIRPKIIILVGPTGVGKTTTVAKLAANFGVDENGDHKRRVTLITIDTYRIGARQQLETYSNVMGFPCFAVGDYDELKKTIALNNEGTDLIIVDTIGKNPRDMVQLGEMKKILDACGTLTEVHLVITAATKASDIKEILRHFESFNYRSVIVTKLDETIRTGNIIGTLSEASKSVSYITNGQKVPTDIRKASVMQFLTNLEGFRVNRLKLDDKFPDRGQEQMQQWG